MPLRVVHLLEALEPGGLERAVIDLACAQRAGGVAAEIYCIFEKGVLAAQTEALGVPVTAGRKGRGNDLGWLRRLRRHMTKGGGGVLHSHNPVANYLAAAALLGTGIPIVNTAHDLGHRFASPKVRRLYRLSIARTNAFAAVSAASRAAYLAKGIVTGRPITVVPNGIPLPPAATPATRLAARALLPALADADFVFGSVGRLVELKNHALLLRAFAAVARAAPRASLVIVGDGPLHADLVAQSASLGIAERVLLTGFREDSRTLMSAFDAYVQSSDTEGYSVALLEAAAAGLPIVATDVGGNSAIVTQDSNGLLVPARDAAALAAAMQAMFDDGRRVAFGCASRAWAERSASVEAAAAAYGLLYRDVAGVVAT
jgi:glycosyltransferase involved in cell wall biosynthesis